MAPDRFESIVLFDGFCGFCSASVRFVIKRDPRGRFAFAPLQSERGKAELAAAGMAGDVPDTVVLIEDRRAWVRSTASLRIARKLSGPWPVFYAFVVVPRGIRDLVYDWFARNRHRWFGRNATCFVPDAGERRRFLS